MQILKDTLGKNYKMKNLGKVNIIIRWQITRDTAMCIIKIDQSAFISDLIIKKRLKKYNANIIPIKASFTIEMLDFGDYNKINL